MAKRDNGDGSVYKQTSTDPRTGETVVRWRGAMVVGWTADDPPKPRRKYVSGRTSAEVKTKLRTLRSDLAQAKQATDPGDTAAGWFTYWLESIAAESVRGTTLAGYRTTINHWVLPRLSPRLKLDKLATEHLEAWYREMREGGLSPTTIRLNHRVISRALKVAVFRGRVVKNVAEAATLPAAEESEVEPLSLEEAQAVLRAAEGRRDEARWSVALALGLRQGEALGLRWEDLDLDVGQLTVRWQLQRAAGEGLRMVPVKSRAGRRTVSLPAALVAALRTHRARQAAERLREGPSWMGWSSQVPHGVGKAKPVDLVFPTRIGTPTSREEDWRAWKGLLRSAGVRDSRLHDARHTAATILLVQGIDPRVAMSIMGWSNMGMAARYQHVVPALRDHAAERVGSYLWGSNGGSTVGSG